MRIIFLSFMLVGSFALAKGTCSECEERTVYRTGCSVTYLVAYKLNPTFCKVELIESAKEVDTTRCTFKLCKKKAKKSSKKRNS